MMLPFPPPSFTCAFTSRAVFSSTSPLRPVIYTLAPLTANVVAIMRPMPVAPPVTMTRLSSTENRLERASGDDIVGEGKRKAICAREDKRYNGMPFTFSPIALERESRSGIRPDSEPKIVSPRSEGIELASLVFTRICLLSL